MGCSTSGTMHVLPILSVSDFLTIFVPWSFNRTLINPISDLFDNISNPKFSCKSGCFHVDLYLLTSWIIICSKLHKNLKTRIGTFTQDIVLSTKRGKMSIKDTLESSY